MPFTVIDALETMHAPQKDSPIATLAGSAEPETIMLYFQSIGMLPLDLIPFPLTIGIDQNVTETVLVIDADTGENMLTVERALYGDAVSWVAGTKCARAMNAADLAVVQENIGILGVAVDGKQPAGDYATNTALQGVQQLIPTTPGDIGAQPAGDYATNAALQGVQQSIPTTPGDIGAQHAGDYATNTALQGVQQSIPTTPGDIGAQPAGDYATNTALQAVMVLIPAQAADINQLADKAFVNSSINSMTANYIAYNAAGDPFQTKAALTGAATYYFNGLPYTPTQNDYAIVLADETYGGAQTRYIYSGDGWKFHYKINDTPFTSLQLAAINSGATAAIIDGLPPFFPAFWVDWINATAATYLKKYQFTLRQQTDGEVMGYEDVIVPLCTDTTNGDFKMRNLYADNVYLTGA